MSAEDSRIASFRAVLDGSRARIERAADDETVYLNFYSPDGYSEIEESEVTRFVLGDLRIIALGEHQCTIAFDATIDVTHRVGWHEPGPDGEMEREWDFVSRQHDVSGTAKVTRDAKTGAFVDVTYVAINEDEIEVRDLPPFWARWR